MRRLYLLLSLSLLLVSNTTKPAVPVVVLGAAIAKNIVLPIATAIFAWFVAKPSIEQALAESAVKQINK